MSLVSPFFHCPLVLRGDRPGMVAPAAARMTKVAAD